MSAEITQLARSGGVDGVHVCVGHILSPLVVFCKSLSHPKPVLLSDDLIDLHDSVWGPVNKTGSGGDCTIIILFKIRRGTPQSHLNNKNK